MSGSPRPKSKPAMSTASLLSKAGGIKDQRRRKLEQFRIGLQGTGTLGGSPVNMHLYVEDVDAFFKRALAAGTKERKPVMDQFYGDRSEAS